MGQVVAAKKRNKAYQGRALPVIIRHSAEHDLHMKLRPHVGLEQLIQGRGDAYAWNEIACRLNIGQMLANTHFTEEVRLEIRKGMDAIAEVMHRFNRVQKWGVGAEEASAIGEALNLTDDMQALCTSRELGAAITHVFKHAAIH